MRQILFIALVALSVPLVVKRPLWGIAIYLGANVVRPEMFFWGGRSGSFVFKAYFCLFVLATILNGYLRNKGRIINREFLLMIWLIIAVLVSFAFAQYPIFRGDYYIIELLKGFGVCAFIYMIVTGFGDVKFVQNVLLGCFSFLGLWGIEQSFRGNERLEGLGGNAWGDSNDLAAVFVMFLPVAFAKFFASENGRERWQATAVIAIMVILIICTQSRGGLLGLIACVAAYGFFTRNMRRIAFASLLMAVVVLPFASQEYFERLKAMKSEDTLDGSAKSRLVLWELGLRVFSDNPLIGTGFLTYPHAKFEYKDEFRDLDSKFHAYIFRTKDMKVTHNTYIQMLSDCGLFGTIPYLLLIFGGISAGFRSRKLISRFPEKKEPLTWLCGLSAGVTGFAVCIITINSVLIPFMYFQLVFIGILSRTITKDTEAEKQGAATSEACLGY